jgi:hypothetical protein
MLVRKKMHKDLVTVTKDERMTVAKKLLKEKHHIFPSWTAKKLVIGQQHGHP